MKPGLHVQQRDGRECTKTAAAMPHRAKRAAWLGHRIHSKREIRQRTGVVRGVRLVNRVLGSSVKPNFCSEASGRRTRRQGTKVRLESEA